MMEQTYNPFGEAAATLPTLAGISSHSTHEDSKESSNWLGWILLIGSLVGVSYLLYRWRLKWVSENPIEKQGSVTCQS